MATISNLLSPITTGSSLRLFDVRRDLAAVADLVEQCFSDTLDPDGERYLHQMRAAARNSTFLRWAVSVADSASVPLSGFVWEEDGRLVGNLSLIPFQLKGRRNYLIANVAVHPQYRRRGIARQLTQQGIAYAREHNAPSVWLHVREMNEPAVNLYRDLGFIEKARRTTWYSNLSIPSGELPRSISVGPCHSTQWFTQRSWLNRIYPDELIWHLPLKTSLFRPGMIAAIQRMVQNISIQQWELQGAGRLLGTLSWQASSGFANLLWLTTDPEYEDLAAHSLLLYARQRLPAERPLALDYPAHHASRAIENTGFYPHQTLIWMTIPFYPVV